MLDPFAGGGAIPLEAMRLGCEAVAADLNPVAWFLLRCTLHHPHRLAGQERPLPAFAAGDREFVEAFLKARGIRTPAALREALARFGHGDGEPVQGTALPDPTTYYLLHRKDFGLAPAPAGACILYALSCNVSDADLAGRLDLLAGRGRSASPDDDEDDGDEGEGRRASDVRLKAWSRRRARDLGEPAPDGRPPPLIDCLHKLMQLWKSGEQSRVDAYLEGRGLWRHEVFARVVQAVTELAERGTEERTMLESIQTHVRTHGGAAVPRPLRLDYDGAL